MRKKVDEKNSNAGDQFAISSGPNPLNGSQACDRKFFKVICGITSVAFKFNPLACE